MGREFEMKFAATKADHEALSRRYPHLHPITMETCYYDTASGKLRRKSWTLRRRMENGVAVCALKTPGEGYGHGEWEICCDRIEDAIEPLCAMGAPEQLREFAAEGLVQSCGARFVRMAGIVETADGTAELALDEGLLLGGGREMPLCEVEVELKSGSEEAATTFARELSREFGLRAEGRSKIARALSLLNTENRGER